MRDVPLRIGLRGVTASLVAIAWACSWPSASLDGKRCPCVAGYFCRTDGTCQPGTGSPSTPAFVQVSAAETQTTTCTAPFASAVAAGNLIVVAASWATTGSSASPTISDILRNPFESAIGPTTWAGATAGPTGLYQAQIFYAKNVRGGSDAVTLTIAATDPAGVDFCQLYIQEYQGLDPDSPLDQASASTGSSTQNPPNSGVRTTTYDEELVFGFAASGLTIAGPGSGFVPRSTFSNNLTEDEVVSLAGPYATSFGDSSDNWVALMATFRAGLM